MRFVLFDFGVLICKFLGDGVGIMFAMLLMMIIFIDCGARVGCSLTVVRVCVGCWFYALNLNRIFNTKESVFVKIPNID